MRLCRCQHAGTVCWGVVEGSLVALLSEAPTTGTPPGVGALSPGDVVEVTVQGVGTLTNPVLAEPVG
jgi:hypothetical protein